MLVKVTKGCISFERIYYNKGDVLDMPEDVARPHLEDVLEIAEDQDQDQVDFDDDGLVAVTRSAFTPVATLPSVTDELNTILLDAGVQSVEVLCEMEADDLVKLKRIGEKKAEKLLTEAYAALGLG